MARARESARARRSKRRRQCRRSSKFVWPLAGSCASVDAVESCGDLNQTLNAWIVSLTFGKALEPIDRSASAPFFRARGEQFAVGAVETFGAEFIEGTVHVVELD